MNRIFIPHIVSAGCLLLAASISISAAPVTMTDSHFTISVSRGRWEPGGLNLETRSTESVVPINDSFMSQETLLIAHAEADLLRISTFAAADYPNYDTASASAKSEITFSPAANTLMPIGIEAIGWDHWYFSIGNVSLVDVTTGTTLWDFAWDGLSGTMPWLDQGGVEPKATASLALNTELFESHDYRLTMFTSVNSQEPSLPQILIQVTGIQVVPEPTVFALVVLAGIGLVATRGQRQ